MRKLLIAVIIVFILLSCDTEPMSTEIKSFVGTWITDGDFEQLPKKMMFTENEVQSYDKNNNSYSYTQNLLDGDYVIKYDGSYEFNDTELFIFFKPPSKITLFYEFKDNALYIQGLRYNRQ